MQGIKLDYPAMDSKLNAAREEEQPEKSGFFVAARDGFESALVASQGTVLPLGDLAMEQVSTAAVHHYVGLIKS